MKEDKIERLLRAMENPSDFTDKELEQLFEDEELRDCYNMAIKAEQGFKLRREQAEQRPQAGYQRVWLKVAAVFIGLIMLSGITIAAIQYIRYTEDKQAILPAVATPIPQSVAQDKEPADTLRTFENEELEDILSEVAAYYNLRTQYRDEEIRHIRLYIKWNKLQSAETMVARLNSFEKVNVKLDHDLLCAE
ncbi:MAG: hypothetical protein J5931_07260 [Prevotella sp.]|jgi:hypothetical protein|nr:hypothetical protein [Prevotella sp.]MBQ8991056.1 hypothetical protein [Prevotella sp.]